MTSFFVLGKEVSLPMTELCLFCKEPITTPLDIQTIQEHISLWLPSNLQSAFDELHSALTSQTQEWYRLGKADERLVCIHCYVKEVYEWLKGMDRPLAEQFLEVFSFGFSKESFESDDIHQVDELFGRRRTEFGICDECGEYTDELEYVAGEWMCDECAPNS